VLRARTDAHPLAAQGDETVPKSEPLSVGHRATLVRDGLDAIVPAEHGEVRFVSRRIELKLKLNPRTIRTTSRANFGAGLS